MLYVEQGLLTYDPAGHVGHSEHCMSEMFLQGLVMYCPLGHEVLHPLHSRRVYRVHGCVSNSSPSMQGVLQLVH